MIKAISKKKEGWKEMREGGEKRTGRYRRKKKRRGKGGGREGEREKVGERNK